MTRILGAVLAGGRATRFGSDKALAMLDGRTLLDHALATLVPHVERLLVCGRPWRDVDWVADRPASELGPLGGLNAALHSAAARGFDAVLSTACDVPSLPQPLVRQLVSRGSAAFVAQLPVVGFWPVELAPRLDAHLAGGADRSLRGWGRAANAQRIAAERALTNVNTEADLSALIANS